MAGKINWTETTLTENENRIARLLFPFSEAETTKAIAYVSYVKGASDTSAKIKATEDTIALLSLRSDAKAMIAVLEAELSELRKQTVVLPDWAYFDNGRIVVKAETTQQETKIAPLTRENVLDRLSLAEAKTADPTPIRVFEYGTGTFVILSYDVQYDAKGNIKQELSGCWKLNNDNTVTTIPVSEFRDPEIRKNKHGITGNVARRFNEAGKKTDQSWFISLDVQAIKADQRFYPATVEVTASEAKANSDLA